MKGTCIIIITTVEQYKINALTIDRDNSITFWSFLLSFVSFFFHNFRNISTFEIEEDNFF